VRIPTQKVEVKKAICMWCHCHCRVSVHIKDGELIKIDVDEELPQGNLLATTVKACPRARAAAEWFHHSDRLNYPLKRMGEKGEGKWQRISWDQALDEIARKLAELKSIYGPETLAFTMGTYRTHQEYTARFFNLFGSPNLVGGPANVCFCPANVISAAMYGWPGNQPWLRPELTKCLLLLGANPSESHRLLWYAILATQKAGAKLIVVDPRRTKLAERADIWLQPRPGTDGALIMAMINVIITEELYDKEFVERWCHGFDKLVARARDYTPEKVAEITWLPAEKIREAARLYATSKPAATFDTMGIEQLPNNAETMQARFILPAITGNLDVRGGERLSGCDAPVIPDSETELSDKLPPEQKAKMLGAERARLFSWQCYELVRDNMRKVWGLQLVQNAHCHAWAPIAYRAIITDRPYPVRAMISVGSNPMVAHANTKLVYEALKRLDLYVVVDFWMTPSAELADYVLPAASWLERPLVFTLHDTMNVLEVGETAFPPHVPGKYERRTDYDFWRGLGIRLGQEEYWPWQTLEEAYDHRLSPTGYTIREFIAQKGGSERLTSAERKYNETGFGTPTGKVELYSTVLESLGYDPLPRYEEPEETPISDFELAREYPLILITGGRVQPYYHSEHRQIDSFRRKYPDPRIQINPEKASELGIADGDWVWIETPRGRVKQKCQYFAGIDPRVVHAQHGWWFPEQPGEEPWLRGAWESNVNVLTDDDPEHCNQISGGWPLRTGLCKVYKVTTY